MQNITQQPMTPIILWGTRLSPYVRKVMFALEEKNIAYEQKEILPKVLLEATGEDIPSDFLLTSPLGKIPALQVGAVYLADSAVIAQYLDKKFTNGVRLYPENPEQYAKSLWFERYSDDILTQVAYKKIFVELVIKPKILNCASDLKVVEEAKDKELPPLLTYLNDSLAQTYWFAGEQISMADIAVATQLLALDVAGYKIDARLRHLHRFLTEIFKRPAFKKVIG